MTDRPPVGQLSLDLVAGTDPRVKDALVVRQAVFILEQGIDPELEIDEYDGVCWHALAYLDEEPVGTARLIPQDRLVAKIGRVAVLASGRKHGIGTQLMRLLEDYARRQGLFKIVLDAQLQVVPFYEGLGYQAEGEVFLDAGILHRRMTRLIGSLGSAL